MQSQPRLSIQSHLHIMHRRFTGCFRRYEHLPGRNAIQNKILVVINNTCAREL
jgi:hypothetical protein